jgi:hypothetical protein
MKVPKQISLEEGSNIFKLIINKNNNNYTFQKTKNMFTHFQKTQVHREDWVFVDDHTLGALPSYVKIDFIGEGHRVSLQETRVNNELGIIRWMGKLGIIKGKEQRMQVVKQAKQMEFLNLYDKKSVKLI